MKKKHPKDRAKIAVGIIVWGAVFGSILFFQRSPSKRGKNRESIEYTEKIFAQELASALNLKLFKTNRLFFRS